MEVDHSSSLSSEMKALQKAWRRTNPIVLLRDELGLSQELFALLIGVDPGSVRLAEQGYYTHLPPRLVRALNAAGFDGDELARRYIAWRAAFQVALRTAMTSPSDPDGQTDRSAPVQAVKVPTPSDVARTSFRSRPAKGASC